MNSGHIAPTWDSEYQQFTYIEEIIKQPELQQYWINAGHLPKNLIIETYAQPNPMPGWVEQLSQHWPNFKNFGYCFHKFSPGRYLPDHSDNYGLYRKKFNVNLDQIVRILVYLEDWKPGQISTLENQVFSNWKAGDWISWAGNATHGVVNFGVNNRYALAITCHM